MTQSMGEALRFIVEDGSPVAPAEILKETRSGTGF